MSRRLINPEYEKEMREIASAILQGLLANPNLVNRDNLCETCPMLVKIAIGTTCDLVSQLQEVVNR